MDDPKFVKKFREAQKPGFYTRVLQTGMVQSGEEVVYKPNPNDAPSLLEAFHLYFAKSADTAVLERALQAPLAKGLRLTLESKL